MNLAYFLFEFYHIWIKSIRRFACRIVITVVVGPEIDRNSRHAESVIPVDLARKKNHAKRFIKTKKNIK